MRVLVFFVIIVSAFSCKNKPVDESVISTPVLKIDVNQIQQNSIDKLSEIFTRLK